MVSLMALLVPIVVAAVLVFIVSSILHMALTYHRADYKKLPKESEALDTLRGIEPGYYFFPHCDSHKDVQKPENVEKFKRGPVGMLTIVPSGPPAMGRSLGLWFAFCLLVGFCTAYIAVHTMRTGAPYMRVFRVTGAVAFLAYGIGNFVDPIWKGQPWSNTLRQVFDGLVYSLVTAGTFGWLWPR